MRTHKILILCFCLAVWIGALVGCAAVQEKVGVLTEAGSKAQSAVETTKTVRSTFADISEEEEYYIGRAVSAMILSQYPVYENERITQYVNLLGNSLAVYSDRPETYAGYHFLVLDSEEVNALAAPGGFIFITKGLLKKCRDEEMLGSILAHEIGHVTAKHGLQSIKKSRLVDAFGLIGKEAAERYSPETLSRLTDIFENALGDIAENLIEKGYDRKYEYEADELSVKYAVQTGYNPGGLLDFLETMVGGESGSSAKGWFRTHPTAQDRISRVSKKIDGLGKPVPEKLEVRTRRFEALMKDL